MNYKYYCDKCNYGHNFYSFWKRHLNTKKHKSEDGEYNNVKVPCVCDECGYKTNTSTNLLSHKLNNHSNREERKKNFKFYCEICDIGAMTKRSYDAHLSTVKHKLVEQYAKSK